MTDAAFTSELLTMPLTLTHYEHHYRTPGGREGIVETLGPDSWLAVQEQVKTIRVRSTYEVGDKVAVHAYGRSRPGVVTKLGRTKVTVDYQQNRQGDRNERAFQAHFVVPANPAKIERTEL